AQSTGRTVIERVVSSYTSTLRTLRYSRENVSTPDVQNVMIVAIPHAPNQTKLKTARLETVEIRKIMKAASDMNTVVRSEGLTVAELKKENLLSKATIVHFACHAVFDSQDPSSSRLLLQDGSLTVCEIAKQKLQKGA